MAGACAGGDLTTLTLDAKTAPLTLNLTTNNTAIPEVCGTGNIAGRVDFGFPPDFFGAAYLKDCAGTFITMTRHPDPSTFATNISGAALFEYGSFVRGPDVLISGPTNRTIDLTMIPVTGRVLVNGAPSTCSGPNQLGTVVFTGSGVRIRAQVTCDQGIARYSVNLPIRSYDVHVVGTDAASNLPYGAPALVGTNVQITAATATLDLNTNAAPVTFTLRQNGAPITCPTTGGNGYIEYYFALTDGSGEVGLGAPCVAGVGYQFTHRVMTGNYKLALQSYNGGRLPNGDGYVLDVPVAATDTAVTINLTTMQTSGTISVDGAPLTNCGSSTSMFAAEVGGTRSFQLDVTCGATTTFNGWLPAGTYDFYISSDANEWPQYVTYEKRLTVAPTMNFALTTRTVSFAALANGAVPQSSCTGTAHRVTFGFDADRTVGGSSGEVVVPCASAGFDRSAVIFEGVQTVTVTADRSTFPVRVSGLTLDSRSSSTFSADSAARHVAGTVTVNGQQAGCMSADYASVGLLDAQGNRAGSSALSCLNGNWVFDFYVKPGTWTLNVVGNGGGMPESRPATLTKLTVP